MTSVTAFQGPLPLRPTRHRHPIQPNPHTTSRRRPRPRPHCLSTESPSPSPDTTTDKHLHQTSTPVQNPPHPSHLHKTLRRALVATAAAATLSFSLPAVPPSDALTLAPTPINPYARRRRERVYKEYVEKLEQTFEAVQVADFKKVVEAGGGGLGVSYRIAGFAAFVASAMSTAVVHPIDSIKTRMQAGLTTAKKKKNNNNNASQVEDEGCDGGEQQPALFDDLYRGLWSNILKEAPNAAIYLGVYELIKSALMNLSVTSFFHDLPLITFLVAGALGDAIGSVVRVPAEIVNKRLQLGVNAGVKSALHDAFVDPAGREGSVVAWQAVLWRDVPYGGLQIMLYEFGKQMVTVHPGILGGMFSSPGVLCDVFMGALAGAVAAMATTPADVLVTKLSVQNPQSYIETRKYMGVGSTAMRILHDEGIGGFFRGTWQRGLYYAPMIGLFFALYEFNRGWLSHPETILATLQPIQGLALEEWRALPAQIAALYSASAPVMAGLMSVLFQEIPLAFSLVLSRG